MKKINLAILEEDRAYVQNLALAIQRKEEGKIETVWYTDMEHYRENQGKHREDVILIGEAFQEISLLESIQKGKAGVGLVLLSADGVCEELLGYPIIEKYSPADHIIKGVYRCAAELDNEAVYWRIGQKQMIGIYAPWNLELSMLFAEVLLQILSERQKVLYVSLQECIGRKGESREWEEENLADLISFLRLKKGGVEARLRSICSKLGKGDYIPSVDNPQNLSDMTRQDYQNLWKALKEQTEYEGILLEFGSSYPGSWEDMKQCVAIYCPYQEDAFQEKRRNQMVHIMKMHHVEDIMEKLHFVKLPKLELGGGAGVWREGEASERLLCSEFGDTVRGLIEL